MTKEDILNLIRNDSWMMDILRAARSLHLPDWMIGAGFVRNKIWDYLHGYRNSKVPTPDIDLIYFDPNNIMEEQEKKYDAQLKKIVNVKWSTKNIARMHKHNKREKPYQSTAEGVSDWPEIPTCIAVRLEDNDILSLFAPHGIEDLVNLIVRPNPTRKRDPALFWERVKSKNWEKQWPKLKIIEQ